MTEIKNKLLDELQDKENDLEFFKVSIASQLGWTRSCDFPDCCWRWCKEIKGQIIATSLESAILFEKRA